MWFARSSAVVVILLYANYVFAQHSTFGTGLEGWKLIGSGSLYHETAGGNPGGYARFEDVPGTGGDGWLIAPAAFLGDWSHLDNIGELFWNHRVINAGNVGNYVNAQAYIGGPGGTATYTSPLVLGQGWRAYSAPITKSAWAVSGSWPALLSNVTELRIRIEGVWNNGPVLDVDGIDNVWLSAGCGSIVAWGDNSQGQCNVPTPNDNFVAVAAGRGFSRGLKASGSIVAWGENNYGQCNVPAPNKDFLAVAGSGDHSVAVKFDGSIVAWGRNDNAQCNVPAPNSGFVAAAGGWGHSLGLKSDGSIIAWGGNWYGQCDVPAPNTGFAAVAADHDHSLGLKADGSIVAWGAIEPGTPPTPNKDFVAVEAGAKHALGMKADGSIVAWGNNGSGQCNVPAPNSGFVMIEAGDKHSLGLKANGSVVAWGLNVSGQCNIPPPNTAFVAVSGGELHSLGLKSSCDPCDTNCDGSVNLADIENFIALVGGSGPAPCSPWAGDANGDGSVNLGDIEAFIACL